MLSFYTNFEWKRNYSHFKSNLFRYREDQGKNYSHAPSSKELEKLKHSGLIEKYEQSDQKKKQEKLKKKENKMKDVMIKKKKKKRERVSELAKISATL